VGDRRNESSALYLEELELESARPSYDKSKHTTYDLSVRFEGQMLTPFQLTSQRNQRVKAWGEPRLKMFNGSGRIYDSGGLTTHRVTDSTDYRPKIWTESTTYLVTTQQANDLVTLAA
jgi:hypothetical protein